MTKTEHRSYLSAADTIFVLDPSQPLADYIAREVEALGVDLENFRDCLERGDIFNFEVFSNGDEPIHIRTVVFVHSEYMNYLMED